MKLEVKWGAQADKQTKGNPHKQKHTDMDRHRYRATNNTDTNKSNVGR